MLFHAFLESDSIMEDVLLVKANSLGVALKDNNGVTKVIEDTYVSEIDGLRGLIILHSRAATLEKLTPLH
jgi:predicted RNA-binding protein